MRALINKSIISTQLVLNRQLGLIIKEGRRRLYSDDFSYCLRRDLKIPFETPKAKIPISIRPLNKNDVPILLNIDIKKIAGEAAKVRAQRLLLLKSKIQKCYVAVTDDNSPCYTQWLIGPKENDKLQAVFKGGYPLLAPNEMLVDGVFTLEAYRGNHIMPEAMSKITEKERGFDSRWIVAFVRADNIPSLKAFKRSGFTPYMVRNARWRLFRRHLTFTKLTPGTPYPFEHNSDKLKKF